MTPPSTAETPAPDANSIDSVIVRLAADGPPDNTAIAQFLRTHGGTLSSAQREAAQRLVTWPVRGPERGGVELGLAALRALPDADEVVAMWSRWIRAGAFDGRPLAPSELARCLALMHLESLGGRDAIDESMRSHVRLALRSADTRRIGTALTHLTVTARAGAPVAAVLVSEAYASVVSREWVDWTARDAETAERLRAEVESVADEAAREIASGTCGAR